MAHMHRYLSVRLSVCHWIVIQISESIIAMDLKFYHIVNCWSMYLSILVIPGNLRVGSCSINGVYVGMMDCQNLSDIFVMGFQH